MTRKKQKSSASGKRSWRKLFIEALGRIPNVTVACEAAHVSRTVAYRERAGSKTFADQWDQALDKGVETLEAQTWRRAAFGSKRNVWMKDAAGNPVKVDEIVEWDTTAAIFMLKAHRPEKYRERIHQQLTGADNGPVKVDLDLSEALERAYGDEPDKG